jgi:hypothetical protein
MIHQRRPCVLAVCAFAMLVARTAAPHDTRQLGALRVTMGWGDEPAFSGLRNSVEVDIVQGSVPVTDAGGVLSVHVSFGDERIELPLVPGDRPGRYHAWLVPTRPGTYAFRVVGTVKGQAIDITSTCSDTTFECVTDVSNVQFPAKDPSTGQLAERVSRALPRAERAMDDAGRATTVGFAAMALAVLALAATIGVGVRRGGRSR